MKATVCLQRWCGWLILPLLVACSPVPTEPSPDAVPEIAPVVEIATELPPYPSLDSKRSVVPPPTEPSWPSCDYHFAATKSLTLSTIEDGPTFSEPVEIAQNRYAFEIAGWLPDNQTLLITRGLQGTQMVATLNTQTGELVDYAHRLGGGDPVWWAERQGIAYGDITPNGWELKLVQTPSETPQIIHPQLRTVHVALHPQTGDLTTVVADPDASLVNITAEEQVVSFDNGKLPSLPYGTSDKFRLSWSPDGRWLVQHHSKELRLFDRLTGSICRLVIENYREQRGEGRVFAAQWSPDSRYLGLILYAEFVPLTELSILDTHTGEIHIIDIYENSNTEPPLVINDFAWSPTGQLLLLKVAPWPASNSPSYHFILVDPQDERAARVWPNYAFGGGAGHSMTWSPDGSSIAYRCPLRTSGYICLMRVQSDQ